MHGEKPKIVFADISEKPCFWLENSGRVVNGDCYWLMIDSKDQDDLLLLALAVGNSKFIETFYDYSFNNKLYSGRRRFMTQYVEKFPLPDPSDATSKKIVKAVKKLINLEFESPAFIRKKQEIDHLVEEAFGVSKEVLR